ncbi:hypothetical protein VNI00_005379 [Paramarasmius palmivorus]|uniref:F-box protein n=1 Tax=Paramarasmius palmivorus TaxID=297713 RepID=A0AAW0DF73_9AGAR
MSSQQLTISEDLFFNILWFVGASHTDLTFLWTTCREVSREFKYAVERLFIAKHLGRTYLRIDAGEHRYAVGGKFSLGVVFCFAHLDPTNRSRAVFRVQENCPAEFKPVLGQQFSSTFKHGNPAGRPGVVVQIHRFANDTAIPDMEPSWEKLEIKVSWMGMYSEWFKEEKEYTRRLKLFMNRLDQSAAEMHRRSEKGKLDLMTFLQTAAVSFPDGSEDLKKAVRGERIAQNVRKESGIDWADTDDAGYQRLKEVSFAVGLDDQDSSSDSASDGEESSDGVEFEEQVDRELSG